MICSNCGADISSKDIKCPYCGAMQYEASEKKYMNDLYKINSDMDNLDKNVRRYALLSIAKSIGYVLIGTAAALVIGVAIGRFDYKQYNDSRKERNEIHKAMDWYDDNSAKLDELYTLQRYSEARDIIRNYDGNTSLMASWEHYNFIQLYDWYYDAFSKVYENVKGQDKAEVMEYQFKNGYRHALDLVNMKENKGSYANRNYKTCSKEDRQIIDMWVENARDYLVNYAGLSEDDIRQQIDELYPDGYYDYKLGQSYEDKYYEEWSRR